MPAEGQAKVSVICWPSTPDTRIVKLLNERTRHVLEIGELKRRAGRAKVFNYRAAFWDGGAKLPTKTKFDGVLVDAPCSGIGTWQRNPQARWTTTPDDVREEEVMACIIPRAGVAADVWLCTWVGSGGWGLESRAPFSWRPSRTRS